MIKIAKKFLTGNEDIEFESDAYSLEDICRVVVRNDICDAKKEESTVLT